MSNDSYERLCRWSGNDHPMDAAAADIELLHRVIDALDTKQGVE